MGPDLVIVVLEMDLQQQMQRIKDRHEGSQLAVDILTVGIAYAEVASILLSYSKFSNVSIDGAVFRQSGIGYMMDQKLKIMNL